MTATHVSFLIRLYNEQPLSLDKLPYTAEFHSLVVSFRNLFGNDYTSKDIWRTLVKLRKSKKLLRKTKSNCTRSNNG